MAEHLSALKLRIKMYTHFVRTPCCACSHYIAGKHFEYVIAKYVTLASLRFVGVVCAYAGCVAKLMYAHTCVNR